MNPFWLALSFLTIVPTPSFHATSEEMKKSLWFYPLVGLLLGALLGGIIAVQAILIPAFPQAVFTVLLLIAWVYLTGGLHMDGWMDLADGLGSRRGGEEMLEIMKDSRVGAMGVTAAILLLFLKGAVIHEGLVRLPWEAFLLPPFVARTGLLFVLSAFPYIRKGGIGEGLIGGMNRRILVIWSIILGGTTFFLLGTISFLMILLTLGAGWIFIGRVSRRLGGLTGDTYGAYIEWTETATLLFLLAGRLVRP